MKVKEIVKYHKDTTNTVALVSSTKEKRGVVFTFLSRLLYNSNFFCKFAKKNVIMNILLTSVGRRTYMIEYFKKALDGKVYVSNSEFTYSMSQADGYFLTPLIYDTNYIDCVLAFCLKNNIRAIISLFDIDLPVLSKNRNSFERQGIKVVVSSWEVTQICNDKWSTYNALLKMSLPQVPTYIILDEAKEAIQKGYLKFPLVLKPRWGMGSIGILEVENILELDVLYKKLERKIFSSYLRYESIADKDHCILIQSKISGNEYGLDIFNDLNGNLVSVVAKKKLAMRAGETDIAETVNSTLFMETARKISQSLKHIANLDVDVFVTPTDEIIVLEMNCRFGGQYPFSHLAGVNFPLQIVKWLKGLPTDVSILQPKVGVSACKDLQPVVFNYY